ncbi:MAG: hypothetical protein Q4B17_10360, partial [Lautropia sp.]|nr:hypothetical protein [Lautropia sp.]
MTPSTPDTRQPDTRPVVSQLSTPAPGSSLASKPPVANRAKARLDDLKKPWELREDELSEAQHAHAEPTAHDGMLLADASGLGQLDGDTVAASAQAGDASAAAGAPTAEVSAAAFSPAMIGGALLGTVALVAAAGSSGGGGSNSQPAGTNNPPQGNQGGNNDQNQLAIQDPGHRDTEPTVQMRPTGPAKAEGPADSPKVALEGLTKLNIASFEQAAVEGKPLEYIRITHIFAADGA